MVSAFEKVKPLDLFFRYDSHWNAKGEQLAALTIAKESGLVTRPKKRLGKIKMLPLVPDKAAFLATMGMLDVAAARGLLAHDDKYSIPKVVPTTKRGTLVENRPLPSDRDPKAQHARATSPICLAGTSYSHAGVLVPLLEHYIGSPIHDFSRNATPPLASLQQLFNTCQNPSQRETIILEYPIYSSFTGIGTGTSLSNRMVQLANFLPVESGTRILDDRQLGISATLRRQGQRRKAQIRSLHPGASGGAHISLRFYGELKGGHVTVLYHAPKHNYQGIWEEGSTRFELPILRGTQGRRASRDHVPAVSLKLSPEAELTLDRVEAWTLFESEASTVLAHGETAASPHNWSMDFPMPQNKSGRDSGLIVVRSQFDELLPKSWVRVSTQIAHNYPGTPSERMLHMGAQMRLPQTGAMLSLIPKAQQARPRTLVLQGNGHMPPPESIKILWIPAN